MCQVQEKYRQSVTVRKEKMRHEKKKEKKKQLRGSGSIFQCSFKERPNLASSPDMVFLILITLNTMVMHMCVCVCWGKGVSFAV